MSPYIIALFTVPPLLVAVILHEIAHGLAAEKLGDPTARAMGRITLNPLKHIDPFMTVILPGLLIISGSPIIFGGAKPVPINPGYFKNPRRGMIWVALAGPMTNFVLAIVSYVMLVLLQNVHLSGTIPTMIGYVVSGWLMFGVITNLILGLFNLIPIPPLDGGRIAVGALPLSLARGLARLEPFGILIVMLLLLGGFFDIITRPVFEFVLPHLARFN